MPWSIAWPTARLASCTSMLPYLVVLISQVPKPIAEQIRSVLLKRRCSIISLPIFLRTNRNRKQTKRGRKRLFNAEVYKHRFCAERTFFAGLPQNSAARERTLFAWLRLVGRSKGVHTLFRAISGSLRAVVSTSACIIRRSTQIIVNTRRGVVGWG